jgi:hypothetical protein
VFDLLSAMRMSFEAVDRWIERHGRWTKRPRSSGSAGSPTERHSCADELRTRRIAKILPSEVGHRRHLESDDEAQVVSGYDMGARAEEAPAARCIVRTG